MTTNQGIIVIESEEYQQCRDALAQDPIIQAMAANAPEGVDFTSWEFISAASRYYHTAGGTYDGPLHIGGPAEAIRQILGRDSL
jgi:hypothetical protein